MRIRGTSSEPIRAIALALVIALATALPAAAQPVKLGLSLPLSGNAAALGRQFLAGARLAVELHENANGIELLPSDDGCDADLAGLAAEDLRDAQVVMVTGFLCNDAATTAADILRESGIPLLVAGARSIRLIKDREREEWNLWRMSPGDDEAPQAAFRILSKRWAATPYAIVDDGTVYGRNLADEFRALMEQANLPPQFVDNFRPAQSTQAGLIRRLQRSGVEAVYLAASAQDAALIGRNMLEFGPNIEIATGEAVSILPYLEEMEDVPVGLLAVTQPEPERLASVEPMLDMLAERGLEPEPYLLLGFAAIQVAAEALAENGAGENVFRAGWSTQTVLGPVTFDADGRNTADSYRLFRWNGEGFAPVDEDVR